MHVVLPPLETFDLDTDDDQYLEWAVNRNDIIQRCGHAIERAGGTYSHEIEINDCVHAFREN